jgi:hypothetical protein
MATINATYLDMIDLLKQTENGKITSTIIEILAETNEILNDMVVVQCNEGTRHKTAIRTGLPTPTWRRLYEGVQPSKSTMKQIHDTTGMAEDWSEIDATLMDLAVDKSLFRLNESKAHLEGMNQEIASKIFYGNTDTAPEEFTGLSPRFDLLSAENGDQIVDAGGTGSDNMSIWFIVWGDRTVHALYPQGTMAGLKHNAYPEETKTNSDGSVLRVVRDRFCWHIGLTVRDWRYVVRVANIDAPALAAGSTDIFKFMRKAYYQLPGGFQGAGKACIYANSNALEGLDAKSISGHSGTASVYLNREEVQGKEVLHYRGIPIRRCDALLSTEARVV